MSSDGSRAVTMGTTVVGQRSWAASGFKAGVTMQCTTVSLTMHHADVFLTAFVMVAEALTRAWLHACQ